MKNIFTLSLLCLSAFLFGQVQVNLIPLEYEKYDKQCVSIDLNNLEDSDVILYGQNYRIYYDASILELDPSSVVSFLPSDSYSEAVIKQDVSHVDAAGFGTLPFESDLGFVNFYIDYNNQVGGALQIESGTKHSIAKLCFDGEAPTNENVLWASREHTSTYATAFNEMKIIQSNNHTQLRDSDIVFTSDLDQDGDIVSVDLEDLEVDYYPNPFSHRLILKLNKVLDERATVQVYDLFGQLVRKFLLETGSSELIVDGADLLAGAYLIRLSTPSGYNTELKALKIK